MYVQVEDPQCEQVPQQAVRDEYDEYDAAADAMDGVGPDDVAAINAAENAQPATAAPAVGGMPSPACSVYSGTRSHHQYASDVTSTGDLGLTAALSEFGVNLHGMYRACSTAGPCCIGCAASPQNELRMYSVSHS